MTLDLANPALANNDLLRLILSREIIPNEFMGREGREGRRGSLVVLDHFKTPTSRSHKHAFVFPSRSFLLMMSSKINHVISTHSSIICVLQFIQRGRLYNNYSFFFLFVFKYYKMWSSWLISCTKICLGESYVELKLS